MYRLTCWVLSVTFLAAGPLGCTGTTAIRSDPPGASVTVDGQQIGQTPVKFQSDQWIFGEHQITLEKAGYQTRQTQFKRDGELNYLHLGLGVFTIVPLFWMFDYRPIHMYKLEPMDQGGQGEPSAADVPHPGDQTKPATEVELAPADGVEPEPADGVEAEPADGVEPEPADGVEAEPADRAEPRDQPTQ